MSRGGGAYVPAGDPEALAEKVHELRNKSGTLAQMGDQGRAYVLRHFTRKIQVRSLERTLLNVVKP